VRTIALLFTVWVAAVVSAVATGGARHRIAQNLGAGANDAKSKEVFIRACTRCHPAERVTAIRRSKAQWEESITNMITARGAQVSSDEFETVLEYLTKEYGRVNVNTATTKDLVETVGIPPVIAEAVVTYRREHGPFADFDALARVPGIDPDALEKKRDAIATDAVVVDPAAAPAGPSPMAPSPQGRGAAAPPTQGRGGGGGAGPDDKPLVDAAAADRGRQVWAAECIDCHGTQARGTENGPNLVRSVLVLHDRHGSELGPFLKKGHRMQSGRPGASLGDTQVADLANFIRQRVNDTLRGSPIFEVQNVLTGDPKAGEAYFTGEGRCNRCHSPAGDLAGIGGRYSPVNLQQRFLFPMPAGRGGGRGRGAAPPGKPITITVTPPSGQSITGVPVQLDDFHVSLRDASGQYYSWKRTAGLTVVKNNPYEAHIELLDRITDKNMHDIVAYLETLK
jgi:cytochrome c oxidase cbb3-type subunit 3